MRMRRRVQLTLGLLVLATVAFGQQMPPPPARPPAPAPPPAPPTPVEPAGPVPLKFQEVVAVPGATAGRLYDSALRWFVVTFPNSKAVPQIQNKETGTLVGRSQFLYPPSGWTVRAEIHGFVRYAVAIEVQDGRYRYTIDNFFHEGTASDRGGPISFGLLTTEEKRPPGVGGGSPEEIEETWKALKILATSESETLVQSMRGKIGAPPDSW